MPLETCFDDRSRFIIAASSARQASIKDAPSTSGYRLWWNTHRPGASPLVHSGSAADGSVENKFGS